MAKIDVTRTELVWPGKYNDDGTRKEVPRVHLPFQVIETINESRATREAEKQRQPTLFDIWEGKEGDTFEAGWKNKLIWGDNLLVMGSLLERFAGKIDLIYIDPPFATGADFTFSTQVGDVDVEVAKEQSVIEEKAYRDTWGRGLPSYLQMLHDRLVLAREFLSASGSIYVHIGVDVEHMVHVLCDEIFGAESYRNTITWKGSLPHGNITWKYGNSHDAILYYACGLEPIWNPQYLPHRKEYIDQFYKYTDSSGRRYRLISCINPNKDRPNLRYGWKGVTRVWKHSRERMERMDREGLLIYSKNGIPSYKGFLDEMKGVPMQDVWDDISTLMGSSIEWENYPTQKPTKLAERIISASSNEQSLVMDFFSGSGTTLVAAERLNRRWIGCDLSRFAIHTTRKRLLGTDGCKPFEILNLGKYERQYWQGVTFGGTGKTVTEQALYEYLAFILKLYGAQPIAGLVHLHGKKGRAMVHIGTVDAPVTIDEINAAVAECVQLKQTELHVLGWEWEMGLYDLMVAEARRQGVKLLLLQIPREVMEQQAVDRGDIQFFELAYLEVKIETPKKLTATVALADFVIPNTELIPEEVRVKVRKWSDYIDYWAVDWNFQNDTFMQGWVTYRTRKDRKLALTSDPHAYDKPGRYRILVKVVDIFGNDTSQAYDVEVR